MPEPELLAEPDTTQPTEAVFHVAFQDGFEDDDAVVLIGDREVFSSTDITSDPRIGLATSFEVERFPGENTVWVRLPRRGVEGEVTVDFSGTAYVGVRWIEGALQFRVSRDPFGYV